jgi:hypothetical protein
LGFELNKFLGQQRLHFLLAEAEMKGLYHELLHRRPDLPAAGVELERRGLMGDKTAHPAPGLHETGPLKVLVHLDHGERIDVEIRGELANRRERGAIRELAGENALLKLLLELQVEGDAAVGVEEKHAVVVQ